MRNEDFNIIIKFLIDRLSVLSETINLNQESDLSNNFSLLCHEIISLSTNKDGYLSQVIVKRDLFPILINLMLASISFVEETRGVSFSNIMERCLKTLYQKEKEYSEGYDRFDQFKNAAKICQCSPGQALLGMMIKHYLSIINMINDKSINTCSMDKIMEKFGDLINYCFLLFGLLVEQYNINLNNIKKE